MYKLSSTTAAAAKHLLPGIGGKASHVKFSGSNLSTQLEAMDPPKAKPPQMYNFSPTTAAEEPPATPTHRRPSKGGKASHFPFAKSSRSAEFVGKPRREPPQTYRNLPINAQLGPVRASDIGGNGHQRCLRKSTQGRVPINKSQWLEEPHTYNVCDKPSRLASSSRSRAAADLEIAPRLAMQLGSSKEAMGKKSSEMTCCPSWCTTLAVPNWWCASSPKFMAANGLRAGVCHAEGLHGSRGPYLRT
mmetsp:Transcript_70520/g.178464  ORF Transcript_70520/g.178464 Transcript_70520/m.178464 type:complete len:246 (-) Transcript_70520:1-738(-)